jgi:hypothetical protein
MCSEFGAHADSNTFALRLDQVPVENNPNQQKLYFLYFQAPATTDEAHLYYVDAFATFLAMTRIFEPFIKNCAKGFPFEDWGTRRDQIDAVVRKELARLHRAMAEPSEDAEGSDL